MPPTRLSKAKSSSNTSNLPHFTIKNICDLKQMSCYIPALTNSSKMAAVVVLDISALPLRSWALTPSPAVILSLECRRTSSVVPATRYIALVLPSVTLSPTLTPVIVMAVN